MLKPRKKPLGQSNVIGGKVAEIRIFKKIRQKDFISRLQAEGLDINPSSFSKLEGQTRKVTDLEVMVIAKALSVSVQELFPDTVAESWCNQPPSPG